MSGLTALFSSRAAQGRQLTRRRPRGGVVAGERLEPRALLTVSVPPSITTDTVEIDDNVVVSDPGGSITATGGQNTSGHVQIFGNSKGRIDGTPGQSNEDLTITADSFITVTGGIGGIQRLDDLTLTSATAQPINLQQMVSLTGDLRVTKAGAFTIGSTVTIDGDLVIDEATMVTFSGNVTVGGDLTITNATGVTFAGMLTVGGALTITNSTGTTRFMGDVSVGSAAVASTTLVQAMADFTTTGAAGDGDVTFTTDQINFTTASLGADPAATDATLVIQPRTTSRALTIASPPGIPAGVNITDADILAIQPGWKRVVFGDEAAGTGAVKIGSIGSQYGGFSQILNTTTIVGGTVQVVQPVDVTTLAIYLELIARGTGTPGSGAVTIDAPINQTDGERSDWVRLTSAGAIEINAPVWATQTVSLTTTSGGTIAQATTGSALTTPALAVDADGAVTLADSGNAVSLVAIKTTNDSVVLREDSGYSISQITTIDDGRDSRPTATVTGIDTGTATVRLVTVSGGTASTVSQGRAILAGGLGLEGAGSDWNLSLATNDIATLAADSGSVVFRDVDDLTIGTVAAVTPRSELSGITVERTLTVTAGTTLAITAAGDIISGVTGGTAATLSAPSGISTAGDVVTEGGDVDFNHATTLTGDVVLDLEDGPTRGVVTFADAVDGTTAGQESLTIAADLDAAGSIGSAVALQSLSVTGDSTLAAGITLRTTGNQTYSGAATSTGTLTIQAGKGSQVDFLSAVTLGGLITGTADTAAYDVQLTGSPVSVTNAVTFANTGTVTLGDAATDSITFAGGVTSTAPLVTELAGTIATTDAAATFGAVSLLTDVTVATGAGALTFAGTVDGAHALSADSSGLTTFGAAVGNTTPLVALVTDAGGTTRISGGSITTAAPVVVVGGEVTALVASGQFYNDAVTLGADATLTAGAVGEIAFAATVDGAYGLVVNTSGSTTFNAAVGGTTPLASLATDSGGTTFVMGLLVKTTGNQSYADRVAFDDSVPAPTSAGLNLLDMDAFDLEVLLPEEDAEAADLDSSASLPPSTRLEGAAVSLLEGLDGGGQQLLIAGNAVFGDQPGSAIDEEAPVDAVVGLTSLSVTGALTVNSTTVETTALQIYQGAVTLGSDVFFGGGGHHFDSTITGPGRTLLMIATSDGITLGGDVGTSAAPLGPIAGLTFVDTILVNAAVYSTGPVTFFSVFGSIDGGPANAIYVPAGDLSLAGLGGVGVTNPIAVEAATVAAISTLGDIRLRGIGDLVVGDDGIMTDGTLSLDASGQIRVPGGRMLRGEDGVTATKPIRWGLVGTADSGTGSLRDVIGQANSTGVAGIVEFGNAPATFVLSSQLPDVTTSLVIDGGNQVTIAGNNRVANGFTFAPGSTGSQLKNVTLQGFRNFGIRLDRSPGVVVDGVRVTSLNTAQSMGLYATGDLTGTTIVGSRFSGGLRGALLVNARNLAFGQIGRGNTFIGNRSAPGSRFAGTGIRAQGDSSGTVVEGNTFTQNHYGFAFINARNLRLANNVFTRNTIAAIFVEGVNTGCVAVGNTFGTGGQKNAKTFHRVRGATGV